ncbi:expressed protein [Phakopsora pachyrhizi]|uniref:Expressed protein n=1 Tax=Phakopsora pachyrhizi TaxID=170000 RepID=A0AAV0B2N2_PHAPC|nr:expressed protein [Phakopsora pachyrhizi]
MEGILIAFFSFFLYNYEVFSSPHQFPEKVSSISELLAKGSNNHFSVAPSTSLGEPSSNIYNKPSVKNCYSNFLTNLDLEVDNQQNHWDFYHLNFPPSPTWDFSFSSLHETIYGGRLRKEVEQSPLIEAPPRSSNQILSLPNAEDLRSYENPPNFASSPIVENDAELLHIFGDNSILKNQLHPKDVEKNFEQRIKESFKLVYVKLRARRITADCFSPSITSRELLKIRRKIHKGKTKEIISVQKKFNEYDQVDAEIDLVALRIGLFIDNYKLDVNERIFGLSSMEFNPKMDEIIEFIKPKPRVTTRVFHAVSQISFKELEILENEIYLFKPKVSSELTEKNLFKAAIQSVNISVLVFARMISHLAGESLWNGNFLNVQYKLWDYLKKFWNCNSTFLSKDSNINFHSLNYLELLPNPKFDIRFILEDFNLDFLQRLDARRKLLCTWKILSLWLPISDKRFAVSKDVEKPFLIEESDLRLLLTPAMIYFRNVLKDE